MHMCDKIVEFCFVKEGKLYQKVNFTCIYFHSIFLSSNYIELNLYIFSFKMI